MSYPLYPQQKDPWHLIGWDSPVAHVDSLEGRNFMPLLSNNSQFLSCQAHTLIPVSTELAQLPIILQSLAYQTDLMLK